MAKITPVRVAPGELEYRQESSTALHIFFANMPTITFVNEKRELQVAEGANLRKEALNAGINLYYGVNGFGSGINKIFNCHGFGHCGTCRVKIVKGMENASPMTATEKFTCNYNVLSPAMFAYIGNEATMRLACCVEVLGDMTVETNPQFNMTGDNFFS
ncbi:MAG: 2Fe-2S iron-sulfur cluster-binding protein [Pirellulales bacterium]|nr:2Fe-2S iron-sulfur cluster-binding protein [Pirellulales bacterium]